MAGLTANQKKKKSSIVQRNSNIKLRDSHQKSPGAVFDSKTHVELLDGESSPDKHKSPTTVKK
jgi:hypothetical protein